jgi:FMN-dependent NADH-azoreductase
MLSTRQLYRSNNQPADYAAPTQFAPEPYGPSLSIDKAFVAYVRGQSDEAGFKTVSQPGFEFLSGSVEFWLRFIGVRSVVSLTVEHSWDGRAVDMIDAGKRQAEELARQF